MMAERQYDLVVVGTGVASAVASRCREAGWSVAVVDSRPFGGTCALRGCNPKKVLVSAAEAVHAVQNMAGRGVRARELAIEWSELMQFKRTFTDPVPELTEQGWAKAGVDLFHGRAHFVGPTTLVVNDDRLVGKRVLIAAGAIPAPMRFPGSEHLTTSEQFLELDTLPPLLVFVGGGYVSFEFAHVAARAGARVTILHRGPRPLEGFDPDLVNLLLTRTREVGIRVELATEVQGIDHGNGQLTVRGLARGEERRFDADVVVHGAGRAPEIDDLDLDAAGIKREKRGVTVNEYLQSVSNPSVYAAGDAAASGPPLTPKAAHDAEVVSTNLLEGNKRKPNYDAMPSVVFTVPPLAAAGLTEDAARAKGLKYSARWQDTSQWLSSRRLGERGSGFKVLIEEGTRRILGAHLFGPDADVTINIFAVAIRARVPADDLKAVLFAYPTAAADIPYML
jgi:glutathione reductase (NADPH)